jgi:hypothetical protein
MAENRIDRELQTREKKVRKRAWTRPETQKLLWLL